MRQGAFRHLLGAYYEDTMKAVINHERGPETYRLIAQTDGRYRLECGGPYRPCPEISFISAEALDGFRVGAFSGVSRIVDGP